jgi:hypothetical protein
MKVKEIIERLEKYDTNQRLKIRVFQDDNWKTMWSNTIFNLDNIFSWWEDTYIDVTLTDNKD